MRRVIQRKGPWSHWESVCIQSAPGPVHLEEWLRADAGRASAGPRSCDCPCPSDGLCFQLQGLVRLLTAQNLDWVRVGQPRNQDAFQSRLSPALLCSMLGNWYWTSIRQEERLSVPSCGGETVVMRTLCQAARSYLAFLQRETYPGFYGNTKHLKMPQAMRHIQ